MNLDYNIFLEVAVIPLDIIICVFLQIRYSKRSKVNQAFKQFAVVVTIANIFDVVTAVVTSAKAAVPNGVHYLFNTVDSMFAAAAAMTFAYYVYSYLRGGIKNWSLLYHTLVVVDYLLLLTNPFTHLVFEYDEAGNYIHKELFILVAYGFPILIFLLGSVYMMIHWKDYKLSQVYTMIASMVGAGIIFFLQMVFFDDMLITFFVASLGVLIIYLSLETPDYEKLIETMQELHDAKEREAASKAKERLSQEIMLALSQAVDAKDHYTNGHSLRVAEYSRAIAKRAGKSEAECEDIFCMGLLHDVGKIGVHEDILNKEGRLSDEEFAAIKTHPVVGYEILQTITEIPGLSTGARCHHERWDGKGYPDGLMGIEIPEEARIICIADCYDAMTSKRSYSVPKSQADVRAEIERCKGTQFDPDLADVMIAIIDDDKDYTLREGNIF
ncbi:MAG: HD-GYP domain-containing protein [Lachnospiraceae bacterium]|nr:HD-GYP domain-containing protein [Lachnospiraceae bacterium]